MNTGFTVNTVRRRHLQLFYRLCLVCVEFVATGFGHVLYVTRTIKSEWNEVNVINSRWVYNTSGSFFIQSFSNLGEIFLNDLNFWSTLSRGLHMNWNHIFLNVNLCKNYLVTSTRTSVFAAHSYISLHFIFLQWWRQCKWTWFFFFYPSKVPYNTFIISLNPGWCHSEYNIKNHNKNIEIQKSVHGKTLIIRKENINNMPLASVSVRRVTALGNTHTKRKPETFLTSTNVQKKCRQWKSEQDRAQTLRSPRQRPMVRVRVCVCVCGGGRGRGTLKKKVLWEVSNACTWRICR